MKIGKVVSIMIISRTIGATLFYSLSILYQSSRGHLTRESVDRCERAWANRLLNIVQLRYRIIHQENCHYLPQRRYIIMSNHASHYDIPLLLAALPGSIRMLAKKELFQIPIFGLAMRKAEFLKIDRGDHETATKDLENAREKMESGIVLWVAPEGTRSRTGEMGTFKKGGFLLAIKTQAIIIPVGLRGTRNVLPADTLQLSLNENVELHIGEPIDASHYTLANRADLLRKVEQQLHELSGESKHV